MKKVISLLLVIVLVMSSFSGMLISSAVEGNNSENEIMPLWTSINSYTAGMEISGLKANFSTSLTAEYATNLKIVVQLQKETSTGYEDVETWTATKTSSVFVGLSDSKIINPFSDYRIRVTFTADQESIVVFKYP